jgi:DNA (cytosine-5)-methyltransferase 1
VRWYYNEIDPYAAQWLRNLIAEGLIAEGDVDGRSIIDVRATDLAGYTQCHFFAGIGGWSYALRLAGWADDRPVWTGSCPCQPFSNAGKRAGFVDDRHLWPAWARLIDIRRPAVIFGEQVASAAHWLRLVRGDLEALGYAVGAMPIEAASAGANHRRDRYWFVADAEGERQQPRSRPSQKMGPRKSRAVEPEGCDQISPRGGVADVADSSESRFSLPERGSIFGTRGRQEGRAVAECSWWSTEPAVGRVAHGIPARVGKLRAFGNAIVPQVAAEFIKAFMETRP